MSHCAQAW